MDTECDFCNITIPEIKPRFYVTYSHADTHRESWEIILTLCPKCFAGYNIHAVLKFAAAATGTK